MSDHEISRIRVALTCLKTETTNLKAGLHEIYGVLDANCIVPSDMIGVLEEVVKRYREQVTTLKDIGSELSIPISEDITEIENAIYMAEQKRNAEYARSIVLDYFKLTAELADVKIALEESKRKLIEKYADDEAKLPSAVEPYGIVVNYIRSGERRMTDDQYDLVEEQIGRSIARATERGDLSIDENSDISVYLDDSRTIHATPRKKDDESTVLSSANAPTDKIGNEDKGNGDDKLDTPVVEEPSENGADMESVKSNTDDEPKLSKQSTFMRGYHGIAKGITVKITGNVSSSSLGTNKYKHLCKEKPEAPIAMFWLGHEKFLDGSLRASDTMHYFSPNSMIANRLYREGYLASLALESNLLTKRYLTLSEKGWACYTKPDVVKYLSSGLGADRKRAGGLIVPAFLRSSAENWDEQTIISIAFIREFFTKKHRNYQVYENPHSGFVCADLISDKSVRVCSCIFVDGNEQASLFAVKNQLAALQDDDVLALIVFAQADIKILTDSLDISSPNVLFSVVEKDYKLMTAQGEEGNMDNVL